MVLGNPQKILHLSRPQGGGVTALKSVDGDKTAAGHCAAESAFRWKAAAQMAQQESAHCEPGGGTLSLLVLGLDHSTAAQSVPLRWYSGTFPVNEGLQWRTSQGMFTAQKCVKW